jgi:hypothetical protein
MTGSATLSGHHLSLRSCDARLLLPASSDYLHRRLNAGFGWDPVAVLATGNTTAICWSSFPTRRNPSRRSSLSSPGASPSATCSPPSSNSSNRPCPYWPWLPPPEGATQVSNVSPPEPTVRPNLPVGSHPGGWQVRNPTPPARRSLPSTVAGGILTSASAGIGSTTFGFKHRCVTATWFQTPVPYRHVVSNTGALHESCFPACQIA